MRNYKDMADAVFRRRDEYVASVKRKKRIALNVSLSLCACTLAVMGAFGIWKLGVVEPDPTIIGTKPQHIVETTEPTLQSLPANATSEGDHTEETAQLISGNRTEPQSSQSTQTDVIRPIVKPTIPFLPSTPIGPVLPVKPTTPAPPVIIIPTVTVPVVTDPVEEPTTEKPVVGEPDVPPTSGDADARPTRPAPMVTDPTEGDVAETVCPTMATDAARPDDATNPPVVQPTWIPQEPTTSVCNTYLPTMPATQTPCGPEQSPPTEPPQTENDCPPTSPNALTFVVRDSHGNGVKGAEFALYSGGYCNDTAVSDSNGYFTLYLPKNHLNAYVVQLSAPNGYEIDPHIVYIGKTPSSDYLFINPKA